MGDLAVCAFNGGLRKKEMVVFFWGVDTPMHTMHIALARTLYERTAYGI